MSAFTRGTQYVRTIKCESKDRGINVVRNSFLNNEKLLPDWLRNIKISPRLIERGTH